MAVITSFVIFLMVVYFVLKSTGLNLDYNKMAYMGLLIVVISLLGLIQPDLLKKSFTLLDVASVIFICTALTIAVSNIISLTDNIVRWLKNRSIARNSQRTTDVNSK